MTDTSTKSPPPTRRTRSDAPRALAVLVLIFIAGAAAGVAGDRLFIAKHALPAAANGLQGRRVTSDPELVPQPIAALNLSAEQEQRVREIARRWRPKAAQAVAPIRVAVASMENDMFAEMMCVLNDAQRKQYVEELHGFHADSAVIATRLRLVTTKACP